MPSLFLAVLPARAQEGGGWRAAAARLLMDRAHAVRSGDRVAFEATMSGAPARFVRARLAWFDRLRALPLGGYELRLDRDFYSDLAPALERRPPGDEVHVVVATERVALRGFDEVPAAEGLVLTVVRRGARWSIVSDSDLESLGLFSSRNVWDFAPVEHIERDDVMVLYHSGRETAERILADTVDARGHVRAAWPVRWTSPVVVAIPRSSRDIGRIFETTVDLGPFVAFAAASVDRANAGYRLGGGRVYLQPDTYFDYSESYQRDTLRHELTHVAGQAIQGAFTPAWLDEGVAQLYGESAVPDLSVFASRVRAGSFPGRLPDTHEFFLPPRAVIDQSYDASASFVLYVRDRFGQDAPARFYRALGRESPVSFGTGRYHLDRASRDALGVPFDRLEREWVRAIRARFG